MKKRASGKQRRKTRKRRLFIKNIFKRIITWIRRYIVFVIVLVVSGIPALFLNSARGYLPILTVVLIMILSRIYLYLLGRSLVYSDESSFAACERETEMDFQLHVKNRSILVYPRVELRFVMRGPFRGGDSTTDTAITLHPREDRVFTFDVMFDHLGTYTVGLDRVDISGPFGVYYKRLPGTTSHTVEVTPHVWQMDTLSISEEVSVENSRAKRSKDLDGMDYSGVRPYAVGDPIKNIHWKLSAHMMEYVTKQTEIFGNTGITTVLDLCCSEEDSEWQMTMYDTLVEAAAAVCSYALGIGMDSSLLFMNKEDEEESIRCTGRESFDDLVHRIPVFKKERKDYPVDMLLREASGLGGQNNIILCTAQPEEEVLMQMRQIRFRGFQMMVFYVMPKGLDPREAEQREAVLHSLDGSGISYYVVSSARELEMGEF